MHTTIGDSHLVLVLSRPRPLGPDLIDSSPVTFVAVPDQLARSKVPAELIDQIDESVARLSTDGSGT